MTTHDITITECLSIFHALTWAARTNNEDRYREALDSARQAGVDAETIRDCWELGADPALGCPTFGPDGERVETRECEQCGAQEGETCRPWCTAEPQPIF